MRATFRAAASSDAERAQCLGGFLGKGVEVAVVFHDQAALLHKALGVELSAHARKGLVGGKAVARLYGGNARLFVPARCRPPSSRSADA